MIEVFKKFLEDSEAHECFITGVAGTGKTTSLAQLIEYCKEQGKVAITTAYTHKAVGVLRSKLPENAAVCTLHSYLCKRPTINDHATKLEHVESNSQMSIPEKVDIVFIDEFSMIGERDYMSLMELVYNDDGDVITKLVFIGDPNQLPPVKDMQTIVPGGDYWIKLTKIYRQANDNKLIDTLLALNDFINGKKATPLVEHETFTRGQNIVELYKACKTSKVLLAYTNQTVQSLNAEIQGRDHPLIGDILFSPTLRSTYTLETIDMQVDNIITIQGNILELGSRFKTLETLHNIEAVQFFTLQDENMNIAQRAVVFGHSNYIIAQQKLANEAVAINKKIEKEFKTEAKAWSKNNWGHELAKQRKSAWAQYLAFKDCVICIDFPHAMTIHKSQGSTYENVYLDMEDINRCADHDYQMYLKLLYVGISRASKNVWTN